MTRSHLPAVLLFMAATSSPLSGQAANPLVGVWGQPDYSMDVPEACLEATLEFRDDGTLESRSGAQVLTGSWTAEAVGDDAFVVVQSDLEANEAPNCQGMGPDTVLANYMHRVYVVVEGDTLRMHVGDSPEAPSFTMVRLER